MLRALVEADEDTRKSMLKLMVEEKYPDALALSPNATAGQLAKVFNERGITGATVDKAISFYLHMLDYVGIGYSQHFKKRRASSGAGARRRTAKKQAQETPPPHSPKPKVTSEEEQKAAYVQTLLDLAKKDGADADVQDRIFDRIEKALGISSSPAAPTAPSTGGGTTDSP